MKTTTAKQAARKLRTLAAKTQELVYDAAEALSPAHKEKLFRTVREMGEMADRIDGTTERRLAAQEGQARAESAARFKELYG